MKSVITAVSLFAVLAFASIGFAQTVPAPPTNFAAAGFAFNGAQSNGWATYAKSIGGGFSSISTVDVTVGSLKPLTFQHSMRTGVGFDVTSIVPALSMGGRLHIVGLSDGGFSATVSALGSAFSGGGYGIFDTGPKLKHLQIVAGGRLLKTSTGGTQPIIEVGIGHTF
jgi:hypothetical protein